MSLDAYYSNNASTNSSLYYAQYWNIGLVVITPLVWAFIALIGVIGNGLVLYIMTRYGDRKPTTLYIINLAVADVAFTVIVVPFNILAYTMPQWIFGVFMCKFYTYMTYISVHATCLTLTAMTIDRYFAIVHPITSVTRRTKMSVIIATLLIWSVSIIVCVPALVYQSVVSSNSTGVQCQLILPNHAWRLGWVVYFVTATYLIPLTVVIACYCLIIVSTFRRTSRSLVSHKYKINSDGLPSFTRQLKQRRRIHRLAKMVALIVSLFAVCWLPIQVFNLWFMLSYEGETMPAFSASMLKFKTFAHTLSYANSCLNPFVYAFMGEGFRRAVRMFFPRLFVANRASSTTSGTTQPSALISRTPAPTAIVAHLDNGEINRNETILLTPL